MIIFFDAVAKCVPKENPVRVILFVHLLTDLALLKRRL